MHTVAVSPTTRRLAQRGTRRYLTATSSVLSGARPTAVTTGSALKGLRALREQYLSEHVHVVGRPTLVRQRVIRKMSKPPRLVVLACVDNSGVKVLNRHGKPLPGAAQTDRSLNLITLVRKSTRWVVSGTAFPDNPNC